MASPHGYRAGTRHKFACGFRRHGTVSISKQLTKFNIGDYVDIVVDGSIHKGMPHHFYHGRTGKVFNINPRSIGVEIPKQVK